MSSEPSNSSEPQPSSSAITPVVSPECRICSEGPDAGRLISPCKCKGSMKFVHVECLEKWRRASINPAAHYRCEQCLYQYSFRRTRIAALLRNPIVGFLATCLAFVLCTVLGGYAAKIALFLFDWDREFLPDSLLSVDYTHLAFGFLAISGAGLMSLLGGSSTRVLGGAVSDSKSSFTWLILLIGAAKSMYTMYTLIQKHTTGALASLEDAVENVQ